MELGIPLRGKDKPLPLNPWARRRSLLVQGKQDMEGWGKEQFFGCSRDETKVPEVPFPSHRFVVVMGVDLSRCGPEHPASRCPWDSGLLLRFLAAMAAVGALEPLLPGPLLAAHPQAGTSR